MEEIHKIREKMSKLSDLELDKELKIIRKKYKNIMAG